MIQPDRCIHGHDFDEANTRIDTSGARKCRTCDAARKREVRSPAPAKIVATAYKTSVVDRVRALKYEPDARLDWGAGDAARKEYEVATGELPRLSSRQKVNGSGSHKVATYPDWFVPRIDRIIQDIAEVIDAADAAQGSLFDGV